MKTGWFLLSGEFWEIKQVLALACREESKNIFTVQARNVKSMWMRMTRNSSEVSG